MRATNGPSCLAIIASNQFQSKCPSATGDALNVARGVLPQQTGPDCYRQVLAGMQVAKSTAAWSRFDVSWQSAWGMAPVRSMPDFGTVKSGEASRTDFDPLPGPALAFCYTHPDWSANSVPSCFWQGTYRVIRVIRSYSGGVAWPESLCPQQVTVSAARMPQVCTPPTLTEVNGPAGGVA